MKKDNSRHPTEARSMLARYLLQKNPFHVDTKGITKVVNYTCQESSGK